MNSERRSFLGLITLLFGGAAVFAGQPPIAQNPPPKFPPRQRPPDLEPAPKPDMRAVLKANQKDLQKDVDRLAELARELKKEVDKTDASEVLSLNVVRKAEEIEKLAKHVKTLARG